MGSFWKTCDLALRDMMGTNNHSWKDGVPGKGSLAQAGSAAETVINTTSKG